LQTDPFTGQPFAPIFRNWELHLENWSNSNFGVAGIEVVWHGKPIEGGELDTNWNVATAQRVQGFVGIDTNSDELFNYRRSLQTVIDTDGDPDTIRLLDVTRQLDFTDNNFNGVYDAGVDVINQEPFAENILVEAFRVDPVSGLVDDIATARFLTGADGNYYFDLDPTFEYEIRITDPLNRIALDDFATPASAPLGSQYLEHYKDVWRITPDWFFAPDRDNPIVPGDEPGEIFYGMSDANGDGIMTASPLPFMDVGAAVPMAVKNINFLLKQDAPVQQFDVTGTVYADLNGDGMFNGDDTPAPGIRVYQDVNRSGGHDAGEQFTETDANGQYTLTIPADHLDTYAVGVVPPNDWIPTDPGGDAVENVFAGPGSPPQIVNFFLDPPSDPDGGNGQLGSILGVVFNDLNENGFRDAGEGGLSNIRVFIDVNENGVWDSATEVSVLTASNGSYFLGDLQPGLLQIDVHIPNEGTPNAAWSLTAPALGYHQVDLGPGGTVLGRNFGLENRSDRDWGDLPNSYLTTAAVNGPSHTFIQGFRLGTNVDGEVDGVPSPGANSDDSVGDTDDGVRVISNGGILQPGVNLVEVTVFGFGGVFTGWIDWDKNGQFDAADRIIWRDSSGNVLGDEADLVQGTFTLQVIAPANMTDGPLAARFRWGEPGLDFFGPALIGEVEDYSLTALTSPLSGLSGDYNNDSTVDLADYIVWRRHLNTNVTLPNDTTPGSVQQIDYDVWRANFGMMAPGAGGGGGEPIEPLAATSAESSSVASPLIADVVASSVVVGRTVQNEADSSPAASSLNIDFGPTVSTSTFVSATSVVQTDAVADSGSDAEMLLLDQVLADLADEAEDAPLADRFRHDDDSVGELELAAVFEDESNWWGV
ncbi:MAG: GEVED domain-containing protein, partial [Pirellulales bacterium]